MNRAVALLGIALVAGVAFCARAAEDQPRASQREAAKAGAESLTGSPEAVQMPLRGNEPMPTGMKKEGMMKEDVKKEEMKKEPMMHQIMQEDDSKN